MEQSQERSDHKPCSVLHPYYNYAADNKRTKHKDLHMPLAPLVVYFLPEVDEFGCERHSRLKNLPSVENGGRQVTALCSEKKKQVPILR